MLFTFPSRYWFAIGLSGVFSLTGWSRQIHARFLVSRATQDTTMLRQHTNTQLSCSMVFLSRKFFSDVFMQRRSPTTPVSPRRHGIGLFRVRSPLLGESLLFSFPAGTKMFQFPALAPEMIRWRVFNTPGCPIRKSPDQRLFAPPRSLSQLITSFIASESQGIRHAPLFTFLIHSPTLACQRDDIYFQLFTTKITVCLYNMS